MPSDTYARWLLDPTQRGNIYGELNPCNYQTQDNCPSAAQALFEFLNDGQVPKRGGARLSGRPAFCPDPGQGFIVTANFQRPRGRTTSEQLHAIVDIVRQGPPGNHVVLHLVRPERSALARDHYASLIKLGPPENDVFYADCSRPDMGMFYPSRSDTPPGGWPITIDSFLLAANQQAQRFEYTRGPFQVMPQPIPQGWRSGGIPKQAATKPQPVLSYRPTDQERGLG